ncbi:uncharacterized protein G2W53_042077 [Senna tora]|uniref:Uncharacterized protein n=1 Tax=Senna tora TaxID=362788 RepID=A0A834SG89_9FABA|nr:uncharacterized protein G2W53_042077 [Senna tora]
MAGTVVNGGWWGYHINKNFTHRNKNSGYKKV